ncbi:DNA-3-methyladenine glycosylase 2 family protein [Candidatus Gottesmanbacteria bacterium]|nr:DNA-3-methyladenine glycosylase 2 family protein [Candidatus Gottesmanbacteria bacterium]
MKKVFEHFRKNDPLLFSYVKDIKSLKALSKSNNFFSDLCEAIINQQLSDKAARTIFNRFKTLFPKEIITAKKLLKITDKKIREVGTSWKKVDFMKNLAGKVVKKEIELGKLENLKDQEVIIELTKLHGIGKWTAEMFLMFSLGREDVFSAGDLGLRRAMQKLYKMKKEPTLKQIEKISNKWSPYRTYAALILWRSVD